MIAKRGRGEQQQQQQQQQHQRLEGQGRAEAAAAAAVSWLDVRAGMGAHLSCNKQQEGGLQNVGVARCRCCC